MIHNGKRSQLEQLVEVVLGNVVPDNSNTEMVEMARKVQDFDGRNTRVVVLGGGTGLSTVVGGNSQISSWGKNPFVGLKQLFSWLEVIVCTTDDGGSTGELLKKLPMIGIGDLRKSCLSLIRRSNICRIYKVDALVANDIVEIVHLIFNYRFSPHSRSNKYLENPISLVPAHLQKICPAALAKLFSDLGTYISELGDSKFITAGHSLGNLLLTAAIFREAGGTIDVPPGLAAIRGGIETVARAIGVSQGTLHAATCTPGQLRFRYVNGVEILGQAKSAKVRRGFPVAQVLAEYNVRPIVSSVVCRALESADMIIYAPGSLYSSMIPVLQLEPISRAIRSNKEALKILGANFWVQEGETDIALEDERRGFLVSELIEAYDRNVIGGAKGLFNIVLSANIDHVPGSVLRNYALEGKRPIHLDRDKVESFGLQTVEATLFPEDLSPGVGVIHHDPERFARAIKTLLFSHRYEPKLLEKSNSSHENWAPPSHRRSCKLMRPLQHKSILPCDYIRDIEKALDNKVYRPAKLKRLLLHTAWENRDIVPKHLKYFDGIQFVSSNKWARGMEWDNMLGYYDPLDRRIKLHEKLNGTKSILNGNMLIALGESLLGLYIESRSLLQQDDASPHFRTYEIKLVPAEFRDCFLSDEELHRYLRLARMLQDNENPLIYRITVNKKQSFLPPGLLFGMLYAWYLNSSYGTSVDYEMSLLHWPADKLIRHYADEHERKVELIKFFHNVVFGYEPVS